LLPRLNSARLAKSGVAKGSRSQPAAPQPATGDFASLAEQLPATEDFASRAKKNPASFEAGFHWVGLKTTHPLCLKGQRQCFCLENVTKPKKLYYLRMVLLAQGLRLRRVQEPNR